MHTLPVGNQTPVLHGTGDEVGDGDHVLLRQGVRHAEVVLEEVGDVGADVDGVLHPRGPVWGGEHPELGAVLGLPVCGVEDVMEASRFLMAFRFFNPLCDAPRNQCISHARALILVNCSTTFVTHLLDGCVTLLIFNKSEVQI